MHPHAPAAGATRATSSLPWPKSSTRRPTGARSRATRPAGPICRRTSPSYVVPVRLLHVHATHRSHARAHAPRCAPQAACGAQTRQPLVGARSENLGLCSRNDFTETFSGGHGGARNFFFRNFHVNRTRTRPNIPPDAQTSVPSGCVRVRVLMRVCGAATCHLRR